MSSDHNSAELMRQYVRHSPLALHLGITLKEIDRDRAVLGLEFHESLVTAGDTVHGGAIAALIDTAATVAAWSGVDPSSTRGGATASLTVNYLSAARAVDLEAEACVQRRARSICFCEVSVTAGQTPIASGLATYAFKTPAA